MKLGAVVFDKPRPELRIDVVANICAICGGHVNGERPPAWPGCFCAAPIELAIVKVDHLPAVVTVAQTVEHLPRKQEVVGSTPARDSKARDLALHRFSLYPELDGRRTLGAAAAWRVEGGYFFGPDKDGDDPSNV